MYIKNITISHSQSQLFPFNTIISLTFFFFKFTKKIEIFEGKNVPVSSPANRSSTRAKLSGREAAMVVAAASVKPAVA